MTGRVVQTYYDYVRRKYVTIIEHDNPLPEDIKTNDLADLKKHRERRSQSQNSYCWELIGKLADAMRMSKEEMYLQMLESYGQSLLIPVELGKKPDGYIKYYKYHGRSIINEKVADWYIIYKGSSEFNTKEMSIFIDGIIQECSNLGIPTLTEEQIKSMKLV